MTDQPEATPPAAVAARNLTTHLSAARRELAEQILVGDARFQAMLGGLLEGLGTVEGAVQITVKVEAVTILVAVSVPAQLDVPSDPHD
jgi:hypothetical protein